jgi:ABC-type transporter Mla MlaB component
MAVLEFEPDVDVRTVAQTATRARALITGGELTLDASRVTRCDTAGAQLLVSIARAVPHGAWRLSPSLEEALTGLGVPLSLFTSRPS